MSAHDSWVEYRQPVGDQVYKLEHEEYGVLVIVESAADETYQVTIENPPTSRVDRLSIGPDITQLVHPTNDDVFETQSRAIDSALGWAESTDLTMLADR